MKESKNIALIDYKMVSGGDITAGGSTENSDNYKIENRGISESLQYGVDLAIGISIAIAVVLLSFAALTKLLETFGIKDAISGGGKSGGKPDLWSPIVGLIVILSSWLILNTLNPDILNFTFLTNTDFGAATKNTENIIAQ